MKKHILKTKSKKKKNKRTKTFPLTMPQQSVIDHVCNRDGWPEFWSVNIPTCTICGR